jgi:hypothetical protein
MAQPTQARRTSFTFFLVNKCQIEFEAGSRALVAQEGADPEELEFARVKQRTRMLGQFRLPVRVVGRAPALLSRCCSSVACVHMRCSLTRRFRVFLLMQATSASLASCTCAS